MSELVFSEALGALSRSHHATAGGDPMTLVLCSALGALVAFATGLGVERLVPELNGDGRLWLCAAAIGVAVGVMLA